MISIRTFVWPSVVVACGVALLANLGFWQLRRLEEKTALLARIEFRVHQAPMLLPLEAEWTDLQGLDYAPAKVTGTFIHQDEALVFEPAAKGETGIATKGFAVLTPLKLDDGRIIIVNRGFVPEVFATVSKRAAAQIEGTITVTGVFRATQRRGFFTPADDPAKGIWFTRDPAAIGVAFHLEHVAPVLLDADDTPNAGGWPKGGGTALAIPNNHLEYAATWFGLAATLVAFYAYFVWSVWKTARKKAPL